MHKIPVFVSCPTTLSKEQEEKRDLIIKFLKELQLEDRALGRSDYPADYPLKEVYFIAKHCAGGIILGFEQICVQKGIRKRNTEEEKEILEASNVLLPTPWNQLEAGILYGLKLPLLIFKEKGIEGGIFDIGISDVFIHEMPSSNPTEEKTNELKHVFLKWYGKVSQLYNNY
ncbi:MAG: hypothetical protein HOO91_00465 [Bacteroidales bacterium]|nr:hypothetical protein [Bacteroidales bacterium]